MATTRLHILVDEDLLEEINQLAERLGETRSTVMRLALRTGVAVLPERIGLILKEGSPDDT